MSRKSCWSPTWLPRIVALFRKIPVAVTSAKCWPRKAFIKRPGVVEVSIGRPIPSVGRRPEELMAEVENWIESEMRRLDPDAYR